MILIQLRCDWCQEMIEEYSADSEAGAKAAVAHLADDRFCSHECRDCWRAGARADGED